MSVVVEIRNRQRAWKVDRVRLGAIAEDILSRDFGLAEALLGIHLVGARAMAGLNWRWLRHEGSTDILTFDHRAASGDPLHGELFISVDDAVAQAREFRTRPDAELVRYVIHGILHLSGYDDLEATQRRRMKRVENRLVRRVTAGRRVSGLVTKR